MPWKKGDPKHPAKTGRSGRRAGHGRKKGTPNKSTVELREFFRLFTEANQEKLEAAFKRVLRREPGEAMRIYGSFSEFVIPKLQRTEMTGADGKELIPPAFGVSFPHGFPGAAGKPTEDDAAIEPPAAEG